MVTAGGWRKYMKLIKTGNKRYRIEKRLFGPPLVVLQLEWEVLGREHWSNGGGMVDCKAIPDYTEWKDARIEDLTEGL